MSERLRFIYMHIPKTGGVSFRRALEDSCQADQILHVTNADNFSVDEIPNLDCYRLIHGHLSYVQISQISGFIRIVSLRDPISRCLSTYNFWRDLDPDDQSWPEEAREHIRAAHNMSLEELIDHPNPSIRRKFCNYQTWLLSGESNECVLMQDAHLENALKNLEKFDFIALNDQLDLSTCLLCLKFGLYSPEHTPRLNSSNIHTQLTYALREKVKIRNSLDLQLLSAVSGKSLFELNGITIPNL